MSIKIEITADTFEQMVRNLGGAVRMFVAIPAQPMIPADAAGEVKAELQQAEVVDPPRKPRGRPAKPQTIEATANPVHEATAAPADDAAAKSADKSQAELLGEAMLRDEKRKELEKAGVLDFEKDIRPAVIKFVSDASDPKDPASKKKLFDGLVAHFGVAKASEIPADKYRAVLDYISVNTPKG